MFNVNDKYKVGKPKTRSTLSSPKHSIFSFAGPQKLLSNVSTPTVPATPISHDKIQTKVTPQLSQRQGQLSLSPLQLSLQRSLTTITPSKAVGPPVAATDEEKKMQDQIAREVEQELLLKQNARNSVNSLREKDTMTLVEFGAGTLVANKLD